MESLIVDNKEVAFELMAKKCGVSLGMKLSEHGFVVATNVEATKLRREKAQEIMGRGVERLMFTMICPFSRLVNAYWLGT